MGTIVIAVHAVEFVRILNPVYTETTRGVWTGTITTTSTKRAQATLTVPSWVGTLDIFAHGEAFVLGDAAQTVDTQLFIGGSGRDAIAEDITAGEARTLTRVAEWGIKSPRATITNELNVGTGTAKETNASAISNAITLGNR